MRINTFVRTSTTPRQYRIHTLDVFGTEETVILTSTEAYDLCVDLRTWLGTYGFAPTSRVG